MLIQDAIRAAMNDRPPEGKGRFCIAREAWSIAGKQLRCGPPCLRATSAPGTGFIYHGEFETAPNFPLSAADVLADDWYILRPAVRLDKLK